MKPKVLYIVPSSGLGGAETFIKNIFSHSHLSNFSPVFLLFRPGPLHTWLQEQHAEIELLPQPPPRLSRPWEVLKVHHIVKSLIRKHNIQLVHSTMAYGALFTAWAARSQRIPHVWFQHGPASGWMDQVAAIWPHQTVIVNSEFTLRRQHELEQSIPVPWRWFLPKKRTFQKVNIGTTAPIHTQDTIHNFRHMLQKDYELLPSTVLIAMACRLQKWKGVDLLIEATQKLFAQNLPFFVFIWGDVFDSPEYLEELKKKSHHLPLSFQGPGQDIPLAFAACDIVVNASMQPEPYGLTIIESLSVGKPVVAPNEGGPLEIVRDGQEGRLFAARDAESLANTLGELILGKDLRQKMEKNAHAKYLAQYTPQSMIQQLDEIYQRELASFT